MSADSVQINPPIDLSGLWWVLVALLAVAALAVLAAGLLRWRSGPMGSVSGEDTSLEDLRAQALTRVSDAVADHHAGRLLGHHACQAISRATRQFAGTASDGDADYESASQLVAAARRDPRLLPVATFVSAIQDDCFSPAARPDVDAVATSAGEVIRRWR